MCMTIFGYIPAKNIIYTQYLVHGSGQPLYNALYQGAKNSTQGLLPSRNKPFFPFPFPTSLPNRRGQRAKQAVKATLDID